MKSERPRTRTTRLMISLYTGAGGLDLGLEAVGFCTSLCVEPDPDSRTTILENRPQWKLAQPGDIHKITPDGVLEQAEVQRGEVDLLVGGPPCQPFSKSAFWSNGGVRGTQDDRAEAVPAYFRVVEVALPRAFLLENVMGFASMGVNGDVLDTLRSMLDDINLRKGTNYELQIFRINAASYGVPQIRERLFLLASIDGRKIDLPPPTHGDDPRLKPVATAWDAIGDLDTIDWGHDLDPAGKWGGLVCSIPEGANYLWHTSRGGGKPLFGWRTRYWTFLLKLSKRKPSWTIQAKPGPATGPFHWRNRLLSIRELARLQTFPDEYDFAGDRRSAHCQIGNAVPCAIGELLGLEIRRQLFGEAKVRRQLRLTPQKREDSPRAYPRQPVPSAYLDLVGEHRAHPGPGLGPGKRWPEQQLNVGNGNS